MQKLKYQWDETKSEQNLAKHGVAFEVVHDFNWGVALSKDDTRMNYGEPRYISLAPINNRLHVLAWTVRGDIVRVISLRKANQRERKEYETIH